MVVAKRQGREKPAKIEQRKVQGLERGPQVEQTALLDSPIYIGQAQGEEEKHFKRGAKGPRSLSLYVSLSLSLSPLHVFWVITPSCLEDVFSFLNKTEL